MAQTVKIKLKRKNNAKGLKLRRINLRKKK